MRAVVTEPHPATLTNVALVYWAASRRHEDVPIQFFGHRLVRRGSHRMRTKRSHPCREVVIVDTRQEAVGAKLRLGYELRPGVSDPLGYDLVHEKGEPRPCKHTCDFTSRRQLGLDQRNNRRKRVPMGKISLLRGVAYAQVTARAKDAPAFLSRFGSGLKVMEHHRHEHCVHARIY